MNDSKSQLKSDGENSLLKTLLDIMDTNDGICFAKDVNGNYLYVNKAFVRLVGMDVDDIIGKNDFAIFPEETAAMFQRHDKRVMELNKSESVEEIGTLDGKPISYRTNKTPLLDGNNEVYGVCGIALDITKEKHFENEMNDLVEKLRAANNTKDKLFSIIAHDMRAPFNALIPLTELLSSDDEYIKHADRFSIYEELHKAASNTYDLLENLLSWANERIEDIPIKKERVDIRNLIENSVRPYRQVAKNKKITICQNLLDSVDIFADGKSVQIIFSNLISNAIKFTPRGGLINITSEVNGPICIVTVSDNGTGIKQEIIKTLFDESLFVSNLGTEGEGGTGIGLSLCHELAVRNDAKIYVESVVGEGSDFSVSFNIVD